MKTKPPSIYLAIYHDLLQQRNIRNVQELLT